MQQQVAVPPPDQRIELLLSGDGTSGTALFHGEDHTFGNVLRYVLAAQPSTDFVGYSIPHPSEKVIHLRLQTRNNVSVKQAIISACDLLADMSNHASVKFSQAEKEARANGMIETEEDEIKTKLEPRTTDIMEEQD